MKETLQQMGTILSRIARAARAPDLTATEARDIILGELMIASRASLYEEVIVNAPGTPVLLATFEPDEIPKTEDVAGMVRIMENHQNATPAIGTFVLAPAFVELHLIDEETMNAAGWVRAGTTHTPPVFQSDPTAETVPARMLIELECYNGHKWIQGSTESNRCPICTKPPRNA